MSTDNLKADSTSDFNLHLPMLFLSPSLIFFSLSLKQSVITSESEDNVIKYLLEVRGEENSK